MAYGVRKGVRAESFLRKGRIKAPKINVDDWRTEVHGLNAPYKLHGPIFNFLGPCQVVLMLRDCSGKTAPEREKVAPTLCFVTKKAEIHTGWIGGREERSM